MTMPQPLFPTAEVVIISRLQNGTIAVEPENIDVDAAIFLCEYAKSLFMEQMLEREE